MTHQIFGTDHLRSGVDAVTLAAEHQRLLDENSELRCRVQELEHENAMLAEFQPPDIGVEDHLKLRHATGPIEAFDLFIQQHVAPYMQAHLLDNDDNAGEYVRRAIRAQAEEHAWDSKDDTPAVKHPIGRCGDPNCGGDW